MRTVNEADAQKVFDDLLDLVERGEIFVIERNGKPIAHLEPYEEAEKPGDNKDNCV